MPHGTQNGAFSLIPVWCCVEVSSADYDICSGVSTSSATLSEYQEFFSAHLAFSGVQKLDPGAAVALGAPLLVRMFVPLWVVNATPLPVAAWVVPIQPPPAPSDKDQHASEGLVDPADSIRLETLETENVQMPQGTPRRLVPDVSL